MTAAEKILRKALVGSTIDSREWNSVQAGLRDRAFFSSQVAELQLLDAFRNSSARLAAGESDISRLRIELRDRMTHAGMTPGDGTIKDLFSKARLDVILKTNVATARGFVRWQNGMSPGAFAAFPAMRLLRIRQRKRGRDWAARWKAAGDSVGWQGAARDFGTAVALKDSPIWQALGEGAGGFRDGLGNPYPPFAWGSGMGVVDVPRKEAIELGLVTDEALREKTAEMEKQREAGELPGMNDNLTATFDAGHWSGPEVKFLQSAFGDQLKYTQDQTTGNVTVQWQRCLVRDMFENYQKPTTEGSGKWWNIGKATAKMLTECDKVSPKYRPIFEGRGLTLGPSFAKHTIDHGHWLVDNTPGNIPVMPADLDLVPSLWRSPDYIEAGGEKDSIVLCIETFDGGILKLPVMVRQQVPIPTGLFKERAPTSAPTGIPRFALSGTPHSLPQTP